MKKLAEFRVFGVKAEPWQTPQVFMKVSKAGKRYKTAARNKKLEFWQDYVKAFAKDAADAAGVGVCLGPVWARLDFTIRTEDTELHGNVCSPTVAWNDSSGCWVKQGSTLADVDNLCKAVLDAIQGVVYGNDVQVVTLVSTRRFGPDDTVAVKLWEIEKEDPTYNE